MKKIVFVLHLHIFNLNWPNKSTFFVFPIHANISLGVHARMLDFDIEFQQISRLFSK